MSKRFSVTVHGESFEASESEAWARISRVMEAKGFDPNMRCVPVAEATPTREPSTALVLVREPRTDAPAVQRTPVVAPTAPIRGVTVDRDGAARATTDEIAARAAGFAPKPPVYSIGTMVVQAGVDNARRSRADFEVMPLVVDALTETIGRVRGEKRREHKVERRALRMDSQGRLVTPFGRFTLTRDTFASLCSRIGMPGGSAAFLSELTPEHRAWNVNHWCAEYAKDDETLVLRVRNGQGDGELYAIVSERYTVFDADTFCERIRASLAADPRLAAGRGTVDYDGSGVAVDCLWHSNVKPENYVAGEFFKTGLRFSTNDIGKGSARGSALLWRNLCLNLIIIDQAERALFTIGHLAQSWRFSQAISRGVLAGQRAVEHFLHAWDVAAGDDLRAKGRVVSMDAESTPSMDAATLQWGLFLAAQKRDTLPIRQADIPKLVRAWEVEPEMSRRGMANAITRYAHEGQADVWRADALERAAGQLIQSTKPLWWADPAKKMA